MKKISNIIKKFFICLLVIVTLFTNISYVNASNSDSITVDKNLKNFQDSWYKGRKIGGHRFHIKTLKDANGVSHYGYCAGLLSQSTPEGKTSSSKSVANAGLSYIVRNGYPYRTFTDYEMESFYITQVAVWAYMYETGTTKLSEWSESNYHWSTAKEGTMEYYVNQLLIGARNAQDSNTTASINLNGNNNFTLEGNYWVSDIITVNTTGAYSITVNGPIGTIVKNTNGVSKTTYDKGENLRVYVPVGSKSFNVTINAKTNYKSDIVYIYHFGSGLQDIITLLPSETEAQASIKLNYEVAKTKLVVSKTDATTGKELPGAHLVIKDKNNKVVAEWDSTNEPKVIEGLEAGDYTLTETIAPEDYILSKTTIKFTLRNDGSTTKVEMKNELKPLTKIYISKKDVTGDNELPGAHLVVKDKNNKVVDEWVSTDKPHYLEGLAKGTYTLTETLAPKGYITSTSTITFEVKNDGKTSTVTMYNKMHDLTKVQVTKVDATTGKELPGAYLEVRNSNNEIVDKWISTDKPHYVENLTEGKYTLIETLAPEGYITSKKSIEFEVKHDGEIKSVFMENSTKPVERKPSVVYISKQDITKKAELPGAHLVIKDKNNKVIEEWDSTNAPHYIEGLLEGTYTLTETIAPKGYELSKETITFTVEDGKTTKVVMYNTPYIEVPITALDCNKTVIVSGSLISMLGLGMVFRNVKRKEEE